MTDGEGVSAAPLYRQVKAILLRRIAGGEWRPGEALPAEPKLGATLGVSPGTVRKALDELAAEGVVSRRQGRGTFVAEQTPDTSLFRFFRLVTPDGGRAVPTGHELGRASGRANAAERAALALDAGATVLRVRRLRAMAGGRLIERIALPLGLFPGLDAHKGPLPNTLYDLYERRYGKSVRRARETLAAVALDDADDAEALGLAPGDPVLAIERVAYTFDDAPIEWRRSLVDTRALRYLSDLA